MFSDEGGVGTTSSVALRRRRATRFDFGAMALRFGAAVLAAVFLDGLAARLAGRRFVEADAREAREADRFGAACLRLLAARVRVAFAFRLAIAWSFRNLDSFRLSVVRSVAYRNFNSSRGGRARDTNHR